MVDLYKNGTATINKVQCYKQKKLLVGDSEHININKQLEMDIKGVCTKKIVK